MSIRSKFSTVVLISFLVTLSMGPLAAFALDPINIYISSISKPTVSPTTFNPSGSPLQLDYEYSNLTSSATINAKIYHNVTVGPGVTVPVTDFAWDPIHKEGTGTGSLSWNGKITGSTQAVSDGTYYFQISGSDGSTTFSPKTAAFTVKNSIVIPPIDLTPPTLTKVTDAPSPTTDTTPNYTFHSTEAGTILYGGDCSSSKTTATTGNNTITFNSLSFGTHTNCTIRVRDAANNTSVTLNVNDFTINSINFLDKTPPTLTKLMDIPSPTTDKTPFYTFYSSEAGTIIYTGDCSSNTASAVTGVNSINFNTLALGSHTDCVIQVRDTAGNTSSPLSINDFTVVDTGSDNTPPSLTEITSIPSTTSDATPSYTFYSSEAGAIFYGGDCSSGSTNAVAGNNTITFHSLPLGSHSNCTIQVRDAAYNLSAPLILDPFTILKSNAGTQCAGFIDISKDDVDCSTAITWVKSAGIFTGNPDGSFDPTGLLQRDQIAKLVAEATDRYENGTEYCIYGDPFPDVKSDSWAREYICLGKYTQVKGQYLLTGHVGGKNSGKFLPGNAVNRSEFLTMVLRSIPDSMPSADTASFSDVKMGSWDAPYAAYAYQHLKTIYSGPKLNREQFVTRREAARVLYALHKQGSL